MKTELLLKVEFRHSEEAYYHYHLVVCIIIIIHHYHIVVCIIIIIHHYYLKVEFRHSEEAALSALFNEFGSARFFSYKSKMFEIFSQFNYILARPGFVYKSKMFEIFLSHNS